MLFKGKDTELDMGKSKVAIKEFRISLVRYGMDRSVFWGECHS